MITRDSLTILDKATLIELTLGLSMRIDELEARLNKNSSNSSKPPSSDGLKKPPKPNPKSLRGKSGKNSGGQKGHKGDTLKQVTTPDIVITHTPNDCDICAADLSLMPVIRV
jgi:transposase